MIPKFMGSTTNPFRRRSSILSFSLHFFSDRKLFCANKNLVIRSRDHSKLGKSILSGKCWTIDFVVIKILKRKTLNNFSIKSNFDENVILIKVADIDTVGCATSLKVGKASLLGGAKEWGLYTINDAASRASAVGSMSLSSRQPNYTISTVAHLKLCPRGNFTVDFTSWKFRRPNNLRLFL